MVGTGDQIGKATGLCAGHPADESLGLFQVEPVLLEVALLAMVQKACSATLAGHFDVSVEVVYSVRFDIIKPLLLPSNLTLGSFA